MPPERPTTAETVAAARSGSPDHPVIPVVPLRPDWTYPKPAHLPRPTYWPAVLALGITFLLWGLVSSLVVTVVGIVLFVIALAGWIGELRHGE